MRRGVHAFRSGIVIAARSCLHGASVQAGTVWSVTRCAECVSFAHASWCWCPSCCDVPPLSWRHEDEVAAMSRRGGSADLPLHGGRVPRWLGERMTRLGAVMCEAIVHSYGRDELLRRLAHPFWFQSFGAVMGMDWHSSGI
ncbi:DUF763 domain-containing protein, partial [Xanthomonas euvesicatoria]